MSELWKRITLPGANAIEKLIPDRLVSVAIEKSYDVAAKLAGQEDIKRQAGINDLAELRHRPLEECDRLAKQVGKNCARPRDRRGRGNGRRRRPDHADRRAVALRPVAEDDPPDRLLLRIRARGSKGPAVRPGRAASPRSPGRSRPGVTVFTGCDEIEDLLIEETQEEILTEELTSFLFQLEIFEEVPGSVPSRVAS